MGRTMSGDQSKARPENDNATARPDAPPTKKSDAQGAFAMNAQHGMNRNGVEVEAGRDFDDFDAAPPIDPSVADDRMRDEGPEIRERARANGYVVEPGDEE